MRTTVPVVLAGLLTLSIWIPARGQETESGQQGVEFSLPQNPVQQARQRFDLPSGPSQTVPQEGAVDPERYVVGPGDVFTVSVGGGQPLEIQKPVSADGHLVLPGVGSVEADGTTLATVKERAHELLRNHYENVEIAVALSSPRRFYVHVVGAVPYPGRYLVGPVGRVEQALSRAFVSDTTSTRSLSRGRKVSLRNVVVTHRDGTVDSLDLVQYYSTGDKSQNPYLRDGDVIRVGSYHPGRDGLYVDGNVSFPGSYSYRPGDTVADLLRIAAGGTSLPPGTSVRLTRQIRPGTTRTESYPLREIRDGDEPVALRPMDHLQVASDTVPMGTASVRGAVDYPGTYPVRSGATTIRDLLDRAGGLREDALAHGAYLVRKDGERIGPRERARRARLAQPGASGPGFEAPIDTTLLRHVRMSDLDFFGQQYLLREIQLGDRMPIDLTNFPSSDDTLLVQSGDRLVVPRDQHSVLVIGHVQESGRVAYRPMRSAEDYIREAGGRADGAAEAYVIKAGTKTWKPAGGTEINSGDIVFVYRDDPPTLTEEVERLAIQKQNARFQTTQTIISAVSTLASLVTVYFAITR